MFRKNDNYRGILPQGDGQTLTISGQTNGRYYQSYSVSFFDPWFGGKRPNSFSVSAFYSIQTDVSSQYYNSAYMNNYYNMLSGYGYYGGYGNYYDNYESYYDPDKSIKMFGVSVGWGKRLRWPDDYFTLSAELSYQRFMLKDWSYLYIKLNNGQYMNTGNCNNLSLNLTLSRNSTDNPISRVTVQNSRLLCRLLRLTLCSARRTTLLTVKTTTTMLPACTSGLNTTSGNSKPRLIQP